MRCEECLEKLPALVDREIDTEQDLVQLLAHLEGCPACAREAARMLAVDALARVAVPTPAADWASLAEKLGGGGHYSAPEPMSGVGSDVMTLSEAASYLRVTEDDLAAAVSQVPHVRIGLQLRFHRPTLQFWVAAGGASPAQSGNVTDLASARRARAGIRRSGYAR